MSSTSPTSTISSPISARSPPRRRQAWMRPRSISRWWWRRRSMRARSGRCSTSWRRFSATATPRRATCSSARRRRPGPGPISARPGASGCSRPGSSRGRRRARRRRAGLGLDAAGGVTAGARLRALAGLLSAGPEAPPALVLWLDRADLVALAPLVAASGAAELYLSYSLLGEELPALPPALRDRTFLTFRYALPGDPAPQAWRARARRRARGPARAPPRPRPPTPCTPPP